MEHTVQYFVSVKHVKNCSVYCIYEYIYIVVPLNTSCNWK